MKRIDNLTGLRAVAALWVVMYHINVSNTPLHGNLGNVAAHGSFGVDVFFVLSGFVLSMVYAEKLPPKFNAKWYKRFLGRRFAKIYPLHLLTFGAMAGLLLVAAHAGYNFTSTSDNSAWSALCNVFLIHSLGTTSTLSWNSPSWSVSAEWISYSILFAPMVFTLRRVRTLYVGILCAIAVGAASTAPFLLHKPWSHLTYQGIVRIVPEFLCGYLLYRLTRGKSLQHSEWWTAGGVLLLLVNCYLPQEHVALLIASVMVLLAGLAQNSGGRGNKILANRFAVLLGDASYSIYLMQTFVIIVANQILRRVPLPSSPAALFTVALAETAVCAMVGVVVFLKIEEPLRQRIIRGLDAAPQNVEALGPVEIPGTQADTQTASTIG